MDKIMINKHLSFLGLRAKDKVTGFTGIVTSIGFDLYGCISALINPGLKDDKLCDLQWFDINRLEIIDNTPVMKVPDFFGDNKQAQGEQGPEMKPTMGH